MVFFTKRRDDGFKFGISMRLDRPEVTVLIDDDSGLLHRAHVDPCDGQCGHHQLRILPPNWRECEEGPNRKYWLKDIN